MAKPRFKKRGPYKYRIEFYSQSLRIWIPYGYAKYRDFEDAEKGLIDLRKLEKDGRRWPLRIQSNEEPYSSRKAQDEKRSV